MARSKEATKLVRVPVSLEEKITEWVERLGLTSDIAARAMVLTEGLRVLDERYRDLED